MLHSLALLELAVVIAVSLACILLDRLKVLAGVTLGEGSLGSRQPGSDATLRYLSRADAALLETSAEEEML